MFKMCGWAEANWINNVSFSMSSDEIGQAISKITNKKIMRKSFNKNMFSLTVFVLLTTEYGRLSKDLLNYNLVQSIFQWILRVFIFLSCRLKDEKALKNLFVFELFKTNSVVIFFVFEFPWKIKSLF